jgi:menaquinone-dependent protoporphyrinogen oxidase
MGLLKRWVIHRILREKGVAMPASGELEFTDWAALDLFVDGFITRVVPFARETA